MIIIILIIVILNYSKFNTCDDIDLKDILVV